MSKKKALICEDTPVHRSFLKTFLMSHGFDVTEAEDGRLGWEAAQQDRYDVIFSDLEMPNMNGLELLKRLKTTAATRDVPVVMLTTVDDPQVVSRAETLGALHYIVKPFNGEKMGVAMEKLGVA